MVKYDKLIRDLIPQNMDKKGVKYKLHVASDDEFTAKLREKLSEEVQEFLKDSNPEELADILEVVYALAANQSIDEEGLNQIRHKKKSERGGFEKKLILEETN